jgi:hypothetical protein
MDDQTARINKITRDDRWLLSRLDYLWSNYFSDVQQLNPVFIKFGRHARLRFGSISYDPRKKYSLITITGMFKDTNIPQEVIDHTIAHELVHYTQGFSSPHERTQRHPHAGGVIKKEMAERDLLHLFEAYQKWIKGYRQELRVYYSVTKAPRRRRRRLILHRFGR